MWCGALSVMVLEKKNCDIQIDFKTMEFSLYRCSVLATIQAVLLVRSFTDLTSDLQLRAYIKPQNSSSGISSAATESMEYKI